MATNIVLDEDKTGKSVNATLYRGMIGSLLYLTACRPDIQFSVCLCERFQADLKESHVTEVKRIMRYLVRTIELNLWYLAGCEFLLISYSDADYAGCRLDKKNTSGYCQFLGNYLVSWASKKQHSVALSTTGAEYVAAGSCGTQVLWIKHQILDYSIDLGNVPILCDNTSVINLSKNPILHSRTKHIEIRHYFIRDEVAKNNFKIIFINTENQIADIFTKPLNQGKILNFRRELGMCNFESSS